MNKTNYIDYANYIKYANYIIYTNYVNYITSWINCTNYMQLWSLSGIVWVEPRQHKKNLHHAGIWRGGAEEHTEERGGGSVECISDVTAAGGSMLSDDIILLTQAPPTRHQACRKSRWGTSEQKQRRTVSIPRFDISLSNITTITRFASVCEVI